MDIIFLSAIYINCVW